MASIIQIIKVITLLVLPYDGNGDKLENVVSALEACKPLITNCPSNNPIKIGR